MGITKYCLDTNVVSDILRNYPPVMKNVIKALAEGGQLQISSIVYYEIVRGLRAPQYSRRLSAFYDLYASFPHLFFDRDSMETVSKAAEIYDQLRHGQNIEDADIFIAAIAMTNDCVLVTANDKHFGRVDGLRCVNWRN